MSEAALILLVVAGVVWFIGRQVLPQRVSRGTLVLLPLGLVYLAARAVPAHVPTAQIIELFASLAVSVACGLCQARLTRVFADEAGTWWMQGGLAYLLSWAVFLGARLALRLLAEGPAGVWGAGLQASLWITCLDLGVAGGVRSAATYLRHPQIGAAVARG
ncbi:MAG TPA: hypothetical protein VNM16_06670 [Bacillota bacterium]|nr:hypothetical protein [Bacillota bacterium]